MENQLQILGRNDGICLTRGCRSAIGHHSKSLSSSCDGERKRIRDNFSRPALQSRRSAHQTSLGTARWCFYDLGSGCRAHPLCCGRCGIEFTIALLDPPCADVAQHRDTDVVWPIAGTCRIKFLSGLPVARARTRSPKPELARGVYLPRICFRLLLAAACDRAWQLRSLLLQRKAISVSYQAASCRPGSTRVPRSRDRSTVWQSFRGRHRGAPAAR